MIIRCLLIIVLCGFCAEQGFCSSKEDSASTLPAGAYVTLRKDIVVPRGLSYVTLGNPAQNNLPLTFKEIEQWLKQEKPDKIVTVTALQITPDSRESRRIKANRTLVVSEVRTYQRNSYTQLVIVLHHPIIKSITILTTDDIENIHIAHLEYTDLSKPPFKEGAKMGLFSKYNIAQDYFNISLPKEAVIE
ncbi:MAG: hypothetical protein KAU22_05435 [Desulfuromonadales bacterium]|nr:hypothetical protein [Desulfuromonadales bacterium]